MLIIFTRHGSWRVDCECGWGEKWRLDSPSIFCLVSCSMSADGAPPHVLFNHGFPKAFGPVLGRLWSHLVKLFYLSGGGSFSSSLRSLFLSTLPSDSVSGGSLRHFNVPTRFVLLCKFSVISEFSTAAYSV